VADSNPSVSFLHEAREQVPIYFPQAMTDRQFFDWQTGGGANDILGMIGILEAGAYPWCMIGGLAVNHWATEPMVTQDVDIVLALDRVEEAVDAFRKAGFSSKAFPHSVNLTGTSRVSIQISTDEVYREFPARSVPADIHGILMRVASLEDTLRGKLMACAASDRRASKRQKDLADVARLMESHPEISSLVPDAIRERIGL
jgi:hypothetical protein